MLNAQVTERLLKLQAQDETVAGAIANFLKFGIAPSQFERVLQRNADADMCSTPEGRLLLAIITSAYGDCYDVHWHAAVRDQRYHSEKAEPAQFFFDGRMDQIAGLIGLDSEFVREVLKAATPWARVMQ